MAKSKFLEYQDPSGDGLIDVCDAFVEVPPVPCDDCKCIANGAALTENWRTLESEDAFLNEKNCMYQVVIETSYTTTLDDGEDALDKRYEEYAEQAAEALLSAFNKDTGAAAIRTVLDAFEYTDYDLPARASSRLSLLYSALHSTLCDIQDAEDDEDSDEEGEEADSSGTEVTYTISELKTKLIRIRKGLHLYAAYAKPWRFIEGGNLFWQDGPRAGAVFNLKDYGDWGIPGGSKLAKILPRLDKFLITKGKNIRGVAGGGLRSMFGDTVEKVTVTFGEEYELKKLTAYTVECGEKPVKYFKKNTLKKLTSNGSPWGDSTAMAYLAQLSEMEASLTAREPMPWLEFVKKYTYPAIYSNVNQGYTNTDPEKSAGSCMAEKLQEEAKQFGQDILDPMFSIGDALQYKFSENLCRKTPEEVIEDKINLGLIYDPNTDTSRSIEEVAKEQAFQTLEQDDAVFDEFCFQITANGFENIEEFIEGLGQIKLCGLYTALLEAINCLLGGFSLEESLSTIAKSALRAMSLENFGNLFVGLPPEKQAELDALVKKKFENGEFFKENSTYQQASDAIAGKLDYTKPWEAPATVQAQKEEGSKPSATGETEVAATVEAPSENSRRTLAQQLDGSAAKKELSPNIVFEAYVLALIEVYSDKYFELMEELNKFPGAQLVAGLIASVDCPKPPILEPSMIDWIKDVEVPFCQNVNPISLPPIDNPTWWVPKWPDLAGAFFEGAKGAIQEALFNILMKLMMKVCKTVGDASCGALGLAGDLAKSLPARATGRTNIVDVINESICGGDVDSEQIDNTVVDMFADLGLGASALADTEQVLDFAGDISAATSRMELSNAFLGNPSSEFTKVVSTLVKYEYPDFEPALGTEEDVRSFFGNMGNLMPADFRDQLSNFVDGLPDDDMLPANPSLCATPEQIEDFCALRAEILDGRATEDQIAKLCERPLGDLEDLANALQSPTVDLPPLFSEPGCDDGLIPYETEEATATATTALNGMLEQLKVDFATDMLGNGPGEGKWGLVNMILSDTMGNPYTAHTRKVSNNPFYVDFYTEGGLDPDSTLENFGDVYNALGSINPPTFLQRGAFPYKVADWLEDYMQTEMTAEFKSYNDLQEDTKSSKSLKDAGVMTFGGGVDLLKMPDLGYNVEVRVDAENENLIYLEKARKATADMTLSFRDNCKGLWDEDEVDSMFYYGFDLEFYLSDLVSGSSGEHNRADDNVRIKIYDIENTAAKIDTRLAASIPDLWKITHPLRWLVAHMRLKPENDDVNKSEVRRFEFIASDSTLEEIDLDTYPEFLSTFTTKQTYLPQVVLLSEMIGGRTIRKSDIKSSYDEIMSSITQNFIDLVANNEDAFLYGATYDDLSFDDVEYVIEEAIGDYEAGTSYYEVEFEDDEGTTRTIRNDDQIMGISRMQFENPDNNRVIYLDPNTFGGSYMNPPLYIKPLENKGWLGFIDVMFPDLSPCKPYSTDLIDFEEIQQKVENSYPTIPEDERLKSDPDCVVETPYARILGRAAKSGLESIITGAIKVYVSTFFIKSMATFTKFYPKFPDTFSNIYAAYLVEEMEASLKDAQKAVWEAFNPFKDSEFWYAFLEQSVQLYSRRVDSGDISDPPPAVVQALVRLNDAQERYHYPYKKDLKQSIDLGDIAAAAALGPAAAAATFAAGFKTLKEYRQQKNLEAIQATEEDAKIVLKELVIEQLNIMGEKFIENLKIVGMTPTVYDLDYYLLQYLSQGGESLTLDQEIKEEYADFPTEGDGYYTNGSEFANADGTEYVGYYHVATEDGNPIYVTGEYEGDSVEGETLTPMAKKIIVPIGDITEYGSVDVDTDDTSKPFVIEKYISVNGSPSAPSSAVSTLTGDSDPSQNISDVYPGSLDLVTDNNGRVVGLEGELGVRHGLRFSVIVNGTQYTITEVEVDALDRSLAQIDPLEGDSKLLLCLINKLKEDDKFKLIAQYIFPLKKITATLAIYNGLAFLPSIGEKMVKDNETIGPYSYQIDPDAGPVAGDQNTIYTKPGVALTFGEEDSTYEGQAAIYPPNPSGPDTSEDEEGPDGETLSQPDGGGWASKLDRDPGIFGGIGVLEWDNWDQSLLRNSKSRIKKIFKSYYNSRDFDPSNAGDSSDSGGTVITNEFKSRFKIKPGQNLLPFWKKRMIRTNPFNADGEMCEKKD